MINVFLLINFETLILCVTFAPYQNIFCLFFFLLCFFCFFALFLFFFLFCFLLCSVFFGCFGFFFLRH